MSQRKHRDTVSVLLRCSGFVAFTLVAGGLGWRGGIGAYWNDGAAVYSLNGARDDTSDGLSRSDWTGIRDAYERHRHEVVAASNEPGVWQAHTPGQRGARVSIDMDS
jgi:hypothetical protein